MIAMDQSRLIQTLHRTGHFWTPNQSDGLNVTPDDLPKLTLKDKVVKHACASWQAMDENFNLKAMEVHDRPIIPDGDVGPVTEYMLDLPRCPVPDWAPPMGVVFPKYSDDHAQQAEYEAVLRSMQASSQARAVGSGSFGVPGCDPLRRDRAKEHSIVVNANIANASSEVLAMFDEIVLLIRKWAAEFGLAVRYTKGPRNPTHFFEFLFLAGSTIGINYFPQGSTCNQVVYGKIDSGFRSSAVGHANLWAHEQIGHGVGLNHTRGGYMNSSLIVINPFTIVGDPSERRLRDYFGGDRVPLDDEPAPPPPPPPAIRPIPMGHLYADPHPGGIAIRSENVGFTIQPNTPPGTYQFIVVPDGDRYKFIDKPSL